MKMEKIHFKFSLYIVYLIFTGLFFFSGCGQSTPAVSRISSEETVSEEQTEAEREKEKKLTEGNVVLSKRNLVSYGQIEDCSFMEDKKTLSLTFTMPDIPKSDNALIYLFAFEPYEDSYDFERDPVASVEKSRNCEFQWTFKITHLFQQFVPALLLNGEYVPLSAGMYISNAEVIAGNSDSYPEAESKKGLLLDPEMLGTPLLTDLDVKHAIYNIPLSHIMGETTNEKYPTINYYFKGTAYKFNGAAINSYDNLFTYLTNCGILSTAIVLNDWNEDFPEMIHPLARNEKSGSYYYAFNTAEKEGCLHLEAIASFLTKRYSGGGHGLVSSWVVANEINQSTVWNYMDTNDITLYAAEFEKALRIFYTAAKSNYAGAKVYFSIDHDWNTAKSNNKGYFNGKDLIEAINNAAQKNGNYDWGLAIHPYPNPLTRVNYWTGTYDKTTEAPILTLMNLSTVTDFFKQEEYLDRSGNVRSITITELGFSSISGEKLQAAAFAYGYCIIDANPYIEAFIMNRQTDSLEEIKQGLAFGIYETDQTPKYIYDVFKYIDTEQAEDYTDFMLNILGADSLEEALLWAQ